MAETYSDQPTLEKWNALMQAAQTAGNCRIETLSYTGDGRYGEEHPMRFSFSKKAAAFLVVSRSTVGIAAEDILQYKDGYIHIAWEGGTAVFHSRNAKSQLNEQLFDYFVIGLVPTN